MPTTITIDPKVRDRLKRYGHAGMTYNEILERLMDEADEREFTAEIRRRYNELTDDDLIDLDDVK